MKCRLSAVFYSLTHLWHTFIAQNCGAVVELAAFDQGVDRGGRRTRREHKSIAVAGGWSHEHIATTRAEPKVCRLPAGGRWIRTFGSRPRSILTSPFCAEVA